MDPFIRKLAVAAVIGIAGYWLYAAKKSDDAAREAAAPASLFWSGSGAYNAESVQRLASRINYLTKWECDGKAGTRLGRSETGDVFSIVTCSQGRFAYVELASGGASIMPCEMAKSAGLSCEAMELLFKQN